MFGTGTDKLCARVEYNTEAQVEKGSESVCAVVRVYQRIIYVNKSSLALGPLRHENRATSGYIMEQDYKIVCVSSKHKSPHHK